MKQLLALSLGLFLCVGTACYQTAKDAKEGAGQTVGQVDRAKALSDLTLVTEALMTYYTQNQKYPKSLKELKLDLYYPEDISYDPETGKTRSKTYPDL